MGEIIEAIEDFGDDTGISELAGNIWSAVSTVLQQAWKDVLVPALEWCMALLGIRDEDIISTEVVHKRLLEDSDFNKTIAMMALKHQKDGSGILEQIILRNAKIRGNYNRYFSIGKNEFVDGLPETNIHAKIIDHVTVKSVIDSVYGVNSIIIDSVDHVPTESEWIAWKLQSTHNYIPGSGKLVYNGKEWGIESTDYDYVNDRYIVTIMRVHDVTTDVTTTTTVTVTNIDATTDDKHTVVTVRTVRTSNVDGQISDVTVTTSDVHESVPIGSVVGSQSVNTVSSVDEDVVIMDVLYVVSYMPIHYYVVKYYTTDSNLWKYWLYDVSTNAYPQINLQNMYITNLDMMPLVTLRNGRVNTNADKNSDRYKQSKEILDVIGINIDTIIDAISENESIDDIEDAFIYFGMDISDQDPLISKMMYDMFDFMFTDTSLYQAGDGTGSGSSYMATMTEGPYNVAMSWNSQSRTVITGSIGKVGTYNHSFGSKQVTDSENGLVETAVLFMRKQETPEYYVEYAMDGLSASTFIERGGLTGFSYALPGEGKLIVPLSFFHINNLTPNEQLKIFEKALHLSIYSAQIQHLEWYETEAFGTFLQIVAIVILIWSVGTAEKVSEALWAIAIALGATLALQLVFRMTDNEFVRGLASVAYVFVMYTYGGGANASGWLTAAQTAASVATVMNTYTAFAAQDFQKDVDGFEKQYKTRQEEMEAKQEALDAETFLDPLFVASLTLQPAKANSGTVSSFYHIAKGGLQYDYDMLFSNTYSRLYNYDNKFKLGIV